MAQLGVWYDGRYEEWDSYVEKIGQRARDERRAAQQKLQSRQQPNSERMTKAGRKLVEDFE